MEDITLFFEEIPMRKIKIKNEWWISAVDTARAIGYSNPNRDATLIISRNSDRFKGYSTQFKLMNVEKTRNGGSREVKRNVTMLNIKGVIAFCMLSNLPNAIPFQRWADEVLANHIKEKVKRKKIYGELTDDSVGTRNLETKQWQRHGAKGKDFGSLTKKEYQVIFGDETKKKSDMTGEEILKLMISNATNALSLMNKDNPVGVNGIEKQIYKTSKMIESIK